MALNLKRMAKCHLSAIFRYLPIYYSAGATMGFSWIFMFVNRSKSWRHLNDALSCSIPKYKNASYPVLVNICWDRMGSISYFNSALGSRKRLCEWLLWKEWLKDYGFMEKNEKISMSGIKIIYIAILFSQECTESINSNSAVVTLYDGLAR